MRMTREITVLKSHAVMTGSVAAVNISIDGQNGVDALRFVVPEGMEGWAWRVESEQGGQKGYRLLGSDMIWRVRAGEVVEGYATLQLVGSRVDGEATKVWKSVEFHARVLPAINAAEAVTPGETSALDVIAAQVKSDADRADAAVIRAEDAAASAENIVNTAISDIETEGQKQAAAVASSGTQALEAIGQVEQAVIAQVQAAGTAQVGAVEDAADSKLAEINAANAHAPQINEETGKWQVWDAQAGAYVDTGTGAQGPQGETGATGPQGPAGADGIGLPVATAEDAGKVPVVGADGSYTLGDPVPEVDTTLTEAGAPADAAAVGEAIEAISPDDAAVDGKPWTSKQIIDALCPPLEASGNPVTCTPVAGYPLGVKASWGPRQSGEGDPSPDNIRPITGLDEVTVALSGMNLLDYNATSVVSYASYGLQTEKVGDNSFRVYGTSDYSASNASFNIVSNSQTCLRGKGYTIHVLPISGCENIIRAYGLRAESEPYIALFVNITSGQSYDMRFRLMITPDNVVPQEYVPFFGTTATLSLPSTVYGGEVDVATGQGQETYAVVELDGTENIAMSQIQGYNRFSIIEAVPGIISVTGANLNMVCSHYAVTSDPIYSNAKNNAMAGYASTTTIFIRDDAQASVGEYKAYLAAQAAAGTPVTIVYKLATPQPIQATGSQSLPAISGENVLITNADSLTVTGRADPVATVQALADRVAALEQAAVNSINNTTEG